MNIKELIRSENVDFTGMGLSSECKADSVKVREEIKKMQPVLQRYCEYIGIEGMPKYKAIRAYFKDTDFIFNDKSGKVLKMNYDLRLFYDTWYRIAFCQSSMYGVPFEDSDYCTEEREGGMKGCLGKWCQYLMCVQNRGIRQVENCVQNRKKNAYSFFKTYIDALEYQVKRCRIERNVNWKCNPREKDMQDGNEKRKKKLYTGFDRRFYPEKAIIVFPAFNGI